MESFSAAATENLGPQGAARLIGFVDSLESLGATLAWGTGAINGSVNPKWAKFSKRSVLTASTDGTLSLNFEWLNGNEREMAFRDRLISAIRSGTDLRLADDCAEHYPKFPWPEWEPTIDTLIDVLRKVLGLAD